MLLEAQPDGAIALGTFVANYMKYFGHKCKIATFGFSKLTDLIEAVSGVAKVSFVNTVVNHFSFLKQTVQCKYMDCILQVFHFDAI